MTIPHGTITGYTSYRCRCALCRKANAVASQRLRETRKTQRVCRVCGADISHLMTLRCETCLREDREQPYRKEYSSFGDCLA